MSPAIPAATLVLFRDRTDQPPELLMVERSAGMAFAAGAMVFPGGRIDADDRLLAQRFPALEPDDAAARIAAVRETIEESGICAGLSRMPSPDMLHRVRQALAAGEASFSTLLDVHDLVLDLDRLTPFARWRPHLKETRIFDTRFYLADAMPDAPEPVVDDTENVHALWISAADVLAAADRNAVRIIFPTRRNLERLACFASHAEAVRHAADHPVRLVTPWIEDRDGAQHICIPEGYGYPVTTEPLASARRG